MPEAITTLPSVILFFDVFGQAGNVRADLQLGPLCRVYAHLEVNLFS